MQGATSNSEVHQDLVVDSRTGKGDVSCLVKYVYVILKCG
jgi:hypothetical protein